MIATSISGILISRAIAGSTDCSAVLPAATTSSTVNSSAKSRRGIEAWFMLSARRARGALPSL